MSKSTEDRQWLWTHIAGSIKEHSLVLRNWPKENLLISKKIQEGQWKLSIM